MKYHVLIKVLLCIQLPQVNKNIVSKLIHNMNNESNILDLCALFSYS